MIHLFHLWIWYLQNNATENSVQIIHANMFSNAVVFIYIYRNFRWDVFGLNVWFQKISIPHLPPPPKWKFVGYFWGGGRPKREISKGRGGGVTLSPFFLGKPWVKILPIFSSRGSVRSLDHQERQAWMGSQHHVVYTLCLITCKY